MPRPKRIAGFSYRGPHRYFVTFCTRDRSRIFAVDHHATRLIAQIHRTAGDMGFSVLAYCVMPDHVHLLVEGVEATADFLKFVKRAKQRTGQMHAHRTGTVLWQEGYHERVLRASDDARTIARYIVSNPVRAGLVATPRDYPYSGSGVWSLDDLIDSLI